MNKSTYLLSILTITLISCGVKEKTTEKETQKLYSEDHRPQFHFSPKENWMNDPNGMFFYEGEYHLFYQHYPDSNVWGPMHWGHAVSKNLIHWEHLPIALFPDTLGYIFSGSAVVDKNNTSGFGTKDNPPIVAIYTYHNVEGEKTGAIDYQTQGIAYSIDKGRTWKKYEQNPVLGNPGIKDFRDPKVDWNDDIKGWLMALAVKDHVEFYSSPDLKQWKKLSEFGKTEGVHDGVWECPDFFKMKDEDGVDKYVLLLSINPGGPNKGSATQYFVGDFDGRNFKSDTPGNNAGWLDFGTDNYAGVTFSNIDKKDGRRILIGWMSNWLYAQVVPTTIWRSATTVPRVLTLKKFNGIHRLNSEPVVELENIATSGKKINTTYASDTVDVSSQLDEVITTSIIEGIISSKNYILEFSNEKAQKIFIGFDAVSNRYFVDRTRSGKTSFSKDFVPVMYAPAIAKGEKSAFKIIIDVASVEVFFDGGATVLTAIFFPDENFTRLKVYTTGENLQIDSMEVRQITSIW